MLISNLVKFYSEAVGFVDFMAVTMKNAVFWDVVPCGRFGGTCRSHLQGRRYNAGD
jgi:hypothetical protein